MDICPPPQGLMGRLLARIKLMFWTAVAPELVLAWAVRQWFAARVIRDLYNRQMKTRRLKPWSMAHGYFLEMGGFTLVSDKIHQFKESEQPEWLSTSAEWESYNEHVRQRELCQLGILTLERLEELVGDPNVVFPDITTAQINDRSKGDGLSKLLAILQTSWFILQCIARGFQGLALTELELVTLAMASLNAITFGFWWSKPLSVQEPVNVYVAVPGRVPVVAEEISQNNVLVGDYEVLHYTIREAIILPELKNLINPEKYSALSLKYTNLKTFLVALGLYLVLMPIALFLVLTYPVFVLFPLTTMFLLWIIKTKKVENVYDNETVATRVVLTLRKLRYKLAHSIRWYFGRRYWLGPQYDDNLDNNLDYYMELSLFMNWFFITPACFFLLTLVLVLLSPLFVIFFIGSFTFTAAFEIVTTNTVRPGATHVPSFYAPRTKSDSYSRMTIFAIFGVIFGGIHCIGWNFTFPTDSERSLWRYTSLVLTAIPLVAAPIDFILENANLTGRVGKRLQPFLAIFMTTLLFLYVPARLSLIAQAFALLRNQPAEAYVAIDWTKYVPHLFS